MNIDSSADQRAYRSAVSAGSGGSAFGVILIRNGTLSTMPRTSDEKPVVVARRLAHDRANRRHVVIRRGRGRARRSAASRSSCATNTSGRCSSACRSVTTPSTVVPSASSPDASMRPARLARPPRADGVEVLEREADRVHHLVAACAHRIRAMLRHQLAHRLRLVVRARSPSARHVRRRRRRRRAEHVLEDPLAAHDRRRPLGVRRQRQDAALGRAALAAPRRSPSTRRKLAAVDVRHAVVPRQPLVHERVVGGQQIERRCGPRA